MQFQVDSIQYVRVPFEEREKKNNLNRAKGTKNKLGCKHFLKFFNTFRISLVQEVIKNLRKKTDHVTPPISNQVLTSINFMK